MYQGLYVFPLEQNGVERHIIARMRSVHEGGMREFIDPVSGETVGSCGSGFAAKNVKSVSDFIHDVRKTPSND